MMHNTIKPNHYHSYITDTTGYTKSLLSAAWLDTPLGSMLAIADTTALYMLEFIDYPDLKQEVNRIRTHTRSSIVFASTKPIQSIEQELNAYFAGTLHTFTTPFEIIGTHFQKSVWHALTTIPYGQTRSYADQAKIIGNPSAYRAVGTANGANQLAIIIPCHRIITHDGKLGGYGGGINRKQWLLEHERKHSE